MINNNIIQYYINENPNNPCHNNLTLKMFNNGITSDHITKSSFPGIKLKATDDSGFPAPLEVPREPRTDINMLFSRHILIFVVICPITS